MDKELLEALSQMLDEKLDIEKIYQSDVIPYQW